nr:hypothetical protein [Tanacetum cinerariifolium]
MRSIISMVFVSLEGFLPSILLLVVIIVAVVIVAVILVVIVIDTIVGVVIVVASIRVFVVVMIIGIVIIDGGVSHIIKLSFVIIVTFPSMLWGSPPMKASIIFSVFGTMFGHKMANSLFLLGLLEFSMEAAYASRAAATPSVISCRMVASVIAGVADKTFDDELGYLLWLFPEMIILTSIRLVRILRDWLIPSGRDMIHNELSNSTKIDSSKR